MSEIIQNQWIKFHKKIRLADLDNLQPVREKRDMLIDEILKYVEKKNNDEGTNISVAFFQQGSYSMGTGVKPPRKDDDYDIDTAVVFNVSKDDISPLTVKDWVYNALASNFRAVEYKKPCIRVQYKENGNVRFHVDFAIYSDKSKNTDGYYYLAKGKHTISNDQCFWEKAEPKKLKKLLDKKFDSSQQQERKQFKRVIRYLKRWKDVKFIDTVNGKPTGIAFTILAYYGFIPNRNRFTNEENDLEATLALVRYILNEFIFNRISVNIPVEPENDLFEKMTENQMLVFKDKLEKLRDALVEAKGKADPHDACKILQKQFGADFDVPEKSKTAQHRAFAYTSATESA